MRSLRVFIGIVGILSILAGLGGLWVVPATPLFGADGNLDPAGVAYASLFVMVVSGAFYGLILCAPYRD